MSANFRSSNFCSDLAVSTFTVKISVCSEIRQGHCYVKVESRKRPGVGQRVPGGLGYQIS